MLSGTRVRVLLELACIENIIPQTEPVDFSHLAEGEALMVENVAVKNGITFYKDIADDVRISGNSVLLRQLVAIFLEMCSATVLTAAWLELQ